MNSTVISTAKDAGDRHTRLLEAQQAVNHILLGKDLQVRLAFCCLLARGHLLIEDVPGVGKTTLAHAVARVIGSEYQRIQFTSDLLPADILGVSIYKREKDVFEFHPGPIFCRVILADEVNRATPKTQSALLEGMAEGQVTIEEQDAHSAQPVFRHGDPESARPGGHLSACLIPSSTDSCSASPWAIRTRRQNASC